MAKLKFGMIVTEGRNKLGGHVLSRNRAGAYARTKVTPVNPQTSYQSGVRALFTGLSQAWRGLTNAQRLAWNAAVSNFQKTDIFGDLVSPTGKNLYLALNRNLQLVSGTAITSPPNPAGTFSLTSVTVAAAAGAGTVAITFAPTPVPAGMAVIVEATTGTSVGKYFVKNLFRNLGTIAAAATSPQAFGTAYVARFGSMTAGTRVSVRLTPVNITTGERGVPYMATAIVAA